ncbi:MAG: RNA polymerase II transcription factor B subunit 1 [Phylliscum demangeonii]|nr:MAG: RNA polymerase II transcription factor B subunit 1 [Phylliscum demangeonii]
MPPTPPRGSASYKKKDGTLTLSRDLGTVLWTPIAPPGASPGLSFAVSSITNLQQTPASSAKVMLKIFAQLADASAPQTHVFAFTSPTAARAEADALKDALSKAIQTAKAASEATANGAAGRSQPGALAGASMPSPLNNGPDSSDLYDDHRLRSDVNLQQSLLKADPFLQRTFMESLRTKPESISNAQFTTQFWSTRTSLLRGHAIEKNQSRGAYNVLSTIRSKTEDNVTRLSISKEQIQLIFSQYPLVKRVYDENVPKLNESAFWSKFFLSRLFKKLKGEKIVESDPLDPVIDKYLQVDDDPDRNRRILNAHIPHIIDIEGNEENHSQRKGNRPDLTMRPASLDRVPIIRTLNTLSERIMAPVASADRDPAQPVGMDEATFNELALRDLQLDAQENRIILNIKDQQRFFADGKEKKESANAGRFATEDPATMLQIVLTDLNRRTTPSRLGDIDLEHAIGFNDDSDEEEQAMNDGAHKAGSRSSIREAKKQILQAVAQRRSQSDDPSSATSSATAGVSAAAFDRITLTHATATEFLHHFWSVFLSGDPGRASELGQHVESLERSLNRIKAVAEEAEAARQHEMETKRKEARELYQATGKRMRLRFDAVGGGAQAVNDILGPTISAVEYAMREYQTAVATESADADAMAD